MEGSDDLERFFRRLAGVAGTPAIEAAEAEAILDLARIVAHRFERRLAPVTAYALGLAIDPADTPAERARRVRAVAELLDRLAHDDALGAPASAPGSDQA